ncbi:hypothetical protein PT974_01777 [Cladobotryum mycophilum]|uniref:Uncharacterized protein n=1 Tax=Cladobotryum mycophilum TaxID=491253 RepID=A0ABR0SWB5_9HYPO
MSYFQSLGFTVLDRIHEKQKIESFEKARWCFNPKVFQNIVWAYRLSWLDDGISQALLDYTANQPNYRERAVPTSVDDFLAKTAVLFSPAFSSHLRERFRSFDGMCGEPVADGFIMSHTCGDWACMIVGNMLRTCEEMKRSSLPKVSSLEKAWKPSMPSLSNTDSNNSTAAPLPMIQIRLKGETIKEAWTKNEVISRITESEQVPPTGSPPRPERPQSFMEYPLTSTIRAFSTA